MHPDADPGQSEGEGQAADLPSNRHDSLSRLRGPWTIRQLCALGMILVGGGISLTGGLGEWARLGFGGMVIAILAMAMAHDCWWTRRRHRPLGSAPKGTAVRRRSLDPGGKAARRTGTRRGGKSKAERLERKVEAEPPRPGEGRVPPRARDAGTVRREVPPERAEESDQP
jgi:hypothetical protein